MNINTRDYWEARFAAGDWEAKSGREQTSLFARTQMQYFQIPYDFSGTILDFGCGLGDAMPVYRRAYRNASLVGMDISGSAIEKCKERYGRIAQFIRGDAIQVPEADVIIASNVLEHLSNDTEVAGLLLAKCRSLYIIVPYMETLHPGTEHVNSYSKSHFAQLGEYSCVLFPTRGWSQYGWERWFNVYLKNVVRPLFGKKIVRRSNQILFHFEK